MNFITQMGYLGWFAIGVFLILAELFVPGTYLIWFGFSAFMMGIIVSFISLTVVETLVCFALISAVFAGFGWYAYAKILNKTKVPEKYKYLNDMAGAHIGKIYNLSEDVVDGRSKAKIGDSFWLVEIDEPLKKGAKIKIIDVKDGLILIAQKASEK
ncbi:MAG: NfeD family protein [Alphaproteobacteria bacterium]|nr:NfeD family protein [Alphaproteobacteria bacterium]